MICGTEEHVLDTKRGKLLKLLLVGLGITHTSLDKPQSEVADVQNLEKKIPLLENQVKYYKFAHGLISVFI
jgi:hypothetical protein